MTAKELQKRNARAENLRVLQTEDDKFFVESADGKILYRVTFDDENTSCSCGDFQKKVKKDPNFKCKHLLSVINCISTGDVDGASYIEKSTPKLDERWIITIEGNQFVKYAGLLDYGHQKGISGIDVETLQLPTKENQNFAICKATVVSKTGESFSDIGDANPTNCSSKVAKHLLRLASTRAIARALRIFTNSGMTCLEELGDLNDVEKNSSAKKRTRKPKKAPQQKKTGAITNKANGNNKKHGTWVPEDPPDDQTTTGPEPGTNKNEPARMSEAQKRAIANLSRRRGISVEEVENMATETYGVDLENLTSTDAASFIRTLQQAA